MKRLLKAGFYLLICGWIFSSALFAQNATEIVRKANDLVMGKTSQGMNKMKVVRPDWSREVSMKIWSK